MAILCSRWCLRPNHTHHRCPIRSVWSAEWSPKHRPRKRRSRIWSAIGRRRVQFPLTLSSPFPPLNAGVLTSGGRHHPYLWTNCNRLWSSVRPTGGQTPLPASHCHWLSPVRFTELWLTPRISTSMTKTLCRSASVVTTLIGWRLPNQMITSSRLLMFLMNHSFMS